MADALAKNVDLTAEAAAAAVNAAPSLAPLTPRTGSPRSTSGAAPPLVACVPGAVAARAAFQGGRLRRRGRAEEDPNLARGSRAARLRRALRHTHALLLRERAQHLAPSGLRRPGRARAQQLPHAPPLSRRGTATRRARSEPAARGAATSGSQASDQRQVKHAAVRLRAAKQKGDADEGKRLLCGNQTSTPHAIDATLISTHRLRPGCSAGSRPSRVTSGPRHIS